MRTAPDHADAVFAAALPAGRCAMTRWTSVLPVLMVLIGPAFGQTGREPDPAEEALPAYLKREPLKPAEGDSALRKLQKERFNAALATTKARYQEYLAGRGTTDMLLDSVQRLTTADLELTDKPAERIAILEKRLALYREADKIMEARYQAGRISLADREEMRYQRLDAEIQLLREKEKK
jgi:hypothetical protein